MTPRLRFLRCRPLPWVLLPVLLVVLSACYLPMEFRAEIRVGANGQFWLDYRGSMVRLPLYKELREGKLTRAEERDKVLAVLKDLRRDPGFERLQYQGNGIFQVVYKRQGSLKDTPYVTFVRQNSRMMSLALTENGLVTFEGTSIADPRAEQLRDMGLSINGVVGVVTDAAVRRQNAQEVRDAGEGVFTYLWFIRSFNAPMPQLELRLR